MAPNPGVTPLSSRYPVAPFALWWRRGDDRSVIRLGWSCDRLTRHLLHAWLKLNHVMESARFPKRSRLQVPTSVLCAGS